MTPESEQHGWSFPLCPEPPHWSLDWTAIMDHFEWVRTMDGCQQDPAWHAEGDVMVHTRMVCEALVDMPRWRALSPENRSVVFTAALMHDIAKPVVSREEGTRIRAPRHAPRGAQMAREVLWQEYLPPTSLRQFQLREQIVALVRHHGLPLYLLDDGDPHRAVAAASQVARLDLVAMLAEADVLGRKSTDRQELLDRVAMFRDFASENNCYTSPRRFASDHTRYLYFQGRQLNPDCESYDDTRLEVIVMSGLPATGKDYWLTQHAADWPMISLDRIRDELGVSPDDAQGTVVTRAKEEARVYLRSCKPFIWNATNTTRPMRTQLLGLFSDYHARIRIVYTETTWEELLRRNRARTNPVPEAVLEKLLRKLDVPEVTEAHQVEYYIG